MDLNVINMDIQLLLHCREEWFQENQDANMGNTEIQIPSKKCCRQEKEF